MHSLLFSEIIYKKDLPAFVKSLLKLAKDKKIWVFEGELGAGKTTLIQHIAKAMGVVEAVTSPTFSLIHEYTLPDEVPLYHIDLYRIENPADLEEIGIVELLRSGYYCFIEWADLAIPLIETSFVKIKIKNVSPENRLFEIYSISK